MSYNYVVQTMVRMFNKRAETIQEACDTIRISICISQYDFYTIYDAMKMQYACRPNASHNSNIFNVSILGLSSHDY